MQRDAGMITIDIGRAAEVGARFITDDWICFMRILC